MFAASEPARAFKIGKIVHARRIVGAPPLVDGRLGDEVWMAAEAATGFTQRDPNDGRPMTEDTRIQFAYDERFLYVAVTCLDSEPLVSGRGSGKRFAQAVALDDERQRWSEPGGIVWRELRNGYFPASVRSPADVRDH